MGFFSWKTQDTDKSIANKYSNKPTFKVYLSDDKGNKWQEDDYDGYGVFGGKDFYVLLAEMNGIKGNKEDKRQKGIDLAFSGKPYLSPNLSEFKDWDWRNEEPENCEYQGYFYDEDEYDEEEEEYEDDDGEDYGLGGILGGFNYSIGGL